MSTAYQRFKIFCQSILPQKALSAWMGKLADCKTPWVKNTFIKLFHHIYTIDLSDARIEDPYAYENFNAFFTRQLKPHARLIDSNANSIASPVDGSISQLGVIDQFSILQAKGHHYSLETLLANDQALCNQFKNGSFATLYLAPHNYHRVHMPYEGKLIKTIFVPGRLYSVNAQTAENVPNLFALNERLICLFETAVGPMIVILVGALIVGSIETVWHASPYRSSTIQIDEFSANDKFIRKGEELGLFKMGSTVILLFPSNTVTWIKNNATSLLLGEVLGKLIS